MSVCWSATPSSSGACLRNDGGKRRVCGRGRNGKGIMEVPPRGSRMGPRRPRSHLLVGRGKIGGSFFTAGPWLIALGCQHWAVPYPLSAREAGLACRTGLGPQCARRPLSCSTPGTLFRPSFGHAAMDLGGHQCLRRASSPRPSTFTMEGWSGFSTTCRDRASWAMNPWPKRCLQEHRRRIGQLLGGPGGRSPGESYTPEPARPLRILGRPPEGPQSLRQLRNRPGRADGKAPLAFPDCAP